MPFLKNSLAIMSKANYKTIIKSPGEQKRKLEDKANIKCWAIIH